MGQHEVVAYGKIEPRPLVYGNELVRDKQEGTRRKLNIKQATARRATCRRGSHQTQTARALTCCPQRLRVLHRCTQHTQQQVGCSNSSLWQYTSQPTHWALVLFPFEFVVCMVARGSLPKLSCASNSFSSTGTVFSLDRSRSLL